MHSMHIAGLQKTSLIDYPGKLSCVIFLTGCNFTCPYCHNPELAKGEYPVRIDPEHFFDFISQRRDFLDSVTITGGEPCLCPDLPALCARIQNLGFSIKLDTNGSQPRKLANIIQDQLIDFVAMDIKTKPEDYGPPLVPSSCKAQILESIKLIQQSGLDHEFRTTCVRPFVDGATVEAIAHYIQGAQQYVLQTFQSGRLLDASHIDKNRPGFSPDEMQELQAKAALCVERCTIR